VNGSANQGVTSTYSNLLESARSLCADIIMSQEQNSGYGSLRKSRMDHTVTCMHAPYHLAFIKLTCKPNILIFY